MANNPLDTLDFSYLGKGQEPAPTPGNPLDAINEKVIANKNYGPGMDIGTSFPMNNTTQGLKQGVQAFLAGGKEGFQQMGEGLKQTGLQAGAKVGITTPQAAQDYTAKTNSAQSVREQQLRQRFPNRDFEIGAGKFTAQNAPFMAIPGGAGGGLLKGLAMGAGIGAAAGATQYSPENKMGGKLATMGLGATAGALPGIAQKVGGAFVGKHADIIKEFQGAGVKPTLGQVLQTQGAQRVDSAMTNVPFSGMTPALKTQQSQMTAKAQGILAKLDQGLHTDTIKAIVNDPSAANHAIVTKLYENAQKEMSGMGGAVPLSTVGRAADAVIENFSKFGSVSPADQKIVDMMTKIKGIQSVDAGDVMRLRETFNRAYKDIVKVPGGTKAMQSIMDGFDQDISMFAQQAGSKADAMLKIANAAFKTSKEAEVVQMAFDKAKTGDAFDVLKFSKSLQTIVQKQGRTLNPETRDMLNGYAKMAGYLKVGLQKMQRTGSANLWEKTATTLGTGAAIQAFGGTILSNVPTAFALMSLGRIYTHAPEMLIAASKIKDSGQLGVQWAKMLSRLNAHASQPDQSATTQMPLSDSNQEQSLQ